MNKNQIIEEIAKSRLYVETLETRNSDEADFYEIAVWLLKEALSDAYDAGFMEGQIEYERAWKKCDG